jgi:hypothetical protein
VGIKKMAQVPNQSTSTSSQTQIPVQIPVYESCLLVSRHKLLQQQEEDLMKICKKVAKVEMLPTDLNELKKLVDWYDAIIGIIPLPLQVQILQLKKPVLLFEMMALGTVKTKEEAEKLLTKSGLEGVILPPAREGEPYRVSVYRGIILVKEIKVVDEYIIRHG